MLKTKLLIIIEILSFIDIATNQMTFNYIFINIYLSNKLQIILSLNIHKLRWQVANANFTRFMLIC